MREVKRELVLSFSDRKQSYSLPRRLIITPSCVAGTNGSTGVNLLGHDCLLFLFFLSRGNHVGFYLICSLKDDLKVYLCEVRHSSGVNKSQEVPNKHHSLEPGVRSYDHACMEPLCKCTGVICTSVLGSYMMFPPSFVSLSP